MARRYQPSQAIFQPGTATGSAGTAVELANAFTTFRRAATSLAVGRQERAGTTAGAATEGTPKLRNNATAFNRAYNNAALRNYVVQHYTDAEASLARLEAEAGNDPEKFRALADGARKGAVQGALAEARGDISEIYNRRIVEGVARITRAQIEEQRQTNKAVLQQGLDTVTDSISRKLSSGVPELVQQAQEEELQYQLMVDGAVASGDISEAEGIALRTNAAKAVTRQLVTGEFERQLREGDPIGFIGSVMAQPVENLSDEEKTQVVGQLFERMNRWQALLAEQSQLEDTDQKARWRDGERNATVATLRRQITVADLANMVARDELDPAVARTLSNELQSPTGSADDPAVKFQVETNLMRYTEDEIASLGGLSHGTRADLILKRRQEAETWKNDQGAQEALRRIDVALGIPSGLGPQFQLTITPEQATAAAKARSYFYDLVEQTPAEERKGLYFDLAQKAIDQSGGEVMRIQLSNEQAALQRYITAAGDPADMNDEERKAYDEVLTRRRKRIADLEAKLQ